MNTNTITYYYYYHHYYYYCYSYYYSSKRAFSRARRGTALRERGSTALRAEVPVGGTLRPHCLLRVTVGRDTPTNPPDRAAA